MEPNIDIHKAAGILIQDRKLLVTRSKGKSFFVAPGGKVEAGETVIDALVRELYEELTLTLEAGRLQAFGTFYAPSHGEENKLLQMDVFSVLTWQGTITPSNEVEEIMWVDSIQVAAIELSSIFKQQVLPRLLQLDLID